MQGIDWDNEKEKKTLEKRIKRWVGVNLGMHVAKYTELRVYWIGGCRQAFVELWFLDVYISKWRIMDEDAARILSDGTLVSKIWPRD